MRNTKNKILKIAVAAIFVAFEFFGFGIFSVVQGAIAPCHYNIDQFFTSDGKTNALPSATINFSGKVSWSATNTNDCFGKTIFLYVNFRNYSSIKNTYVANSVAIPLNSDSGSNSQNFSVNLSQYDLTGLSPAGQANFTLDLKEGSGGNNDPQINASNSTITASAPVTIFVTGSTNNSSGAVTPVVSFNPVKDTYSSGDSLQIYISADKGQVNSLNAGVTDIFIQPIVNGHNLDGFTVKRDALANTTQWKDTQATSANGFKEGQNIITVSFWQNNTSIKLGQGQATLNMAASTEPKAIIDNSSPAFGSTIHITIQNPPGNNWSAVMNFNDGSNVPISSSPFSLDINATEGFQDKTQYPGNIAIFDSSGVQKGLTPFTINVGGSGGGTGDKAGGGTPGVPVDCSKNPDPNKCLYNPIPNQNDITSLLVTIMKGFLGIVAVWAVAFIVIGGFRMIISQGNEEAVAAAKKTIQWAVLGLVVAILSFVIIAVVQNFIGVDVQPVTTTFISKLYNNV